MNSNLETSLKLVISQNNTNKASVRELTRIPMQCVRVSGVEMAFDCELIIRNYWTCSEKERGLLRWRKARKKLRLKFKNQLI